MEYTYLGRSGLKVSRLVLGTMNFGPVTTEEDSHQIMDQALESGINFFDTANVYGWDKKGTTESIIGNWFAASGRREDVVLATKVYGSMGDGPNSEGLSAKHIRRQVEASLKRLQTDYIDLYQFHHVQRNTPWDEIWQAMEILVQQGKVLYVGSSNFAGWHIAQASEAAASRHFLGLVSEQSIYNLLNRNVELEVLPAARNYGLGVIPWSPLAGGLLGGVLAKGKGAVRGADDYRQGLLAQNREKIKAFEAFSKELGHHPANVGLAWLLAQDGVTGPIVGPRTVEQLTASLDALKIRFKKADLAKLDEIFPGPGGPAPEAYAW
ncbi:aryl-alcohol dehydrogenase-like predicted oxidoreductase [Psychromicrobium silvestre]|uniref:Aryl-alcohol dehydrogenase-like predicted oxidoreductase n=1 Tax=Psychromicrobium silvestre TaxID=1645614 RepID=A0A7Y9LU95_9MICC|nr:aldo/keto reductase [Psychromicrobium silvestre]NYE95725.1 aryl-alcohol dehydrogenase-like predicted oxidoreductase [Psychromicrobium silvestre]